ncbi:MAG: GntR family transcriptional regulator, partial [Eubacteriales bacterium]
MDSNRMELHQLIYELFKRQIMFGVHHFEDTLPTMKETSEYFFVSVDTVRKAYLKLKQEGYITLSTGVGAVVSVRYGNRAIRRNIQNFFARRRTALFDLAHSTFPLLSNAQWVSLRYAGPEILDEVEAFCTAKNTPSPYRRVQQFLLIYNSLGNDLLNRLIWQMLLFLQAPFLSYSQNRNYFNGAGPLRDMVQLCRKKDWKALWTAIELFQRQFISALRLFYNERIPKGGGD